MPIASEWPSGEALETIRARAKSQISGPLKVESSILDMFPEYRRAVDAYHVERTVSVREKPAD